MLKLKLQYFGHPMQRTDSLEKTAKSMPKPQSRPSASLALGGYTTAVALTGDPVLFARELVSSGSGEISLSWVAEQK